MWLALALEETHIKNSMPFSISKYKLCFLEHGLLINMTMNGIKIFSSKPNLDVKPVLNIDQITELLKLGLMERIILTLQN